MVRLLLLLAIASGVAFVLHRAGRGRARFGDYARRIRALERQVAKGDGRQSVNTTVTEHALREIAVLRKKQAMELREPRLRDDIEAYLRGLAVQSARRAEELRAAAAAHPMENPFEGSIEETADRLADDYLSLVGVYDVDDWQDKSARDPKAEAAFRALVESDGSIARIPKKRGEVWVEVYRLAEDRCIRFLREVAV